MSSMNYVLQTQRLGLRRYVPADAAALEAVFADPDAARFYPAMSTPAAVERWVGWNLRNDDEHGFGLWAIELLDSGVFIGDAGITYQTPGATGISVLEIGWHVHPAYRARGYATEAARGCMQFGFESLGATDLHSIVDPLNGASIKVATRVHSGRREYVGKAGPMWLFSTARDEFESITSIA